jgi:hypothetical protein
MTAHAVGYEEDPARGLQRMHLRWKSGPFPDRFEHRILYAIVTPEYSLQLICPAEQKQPPKDISVIILFFTIDPNY